MGHEWKPAIASRPFQAIYANPPELLNLMGQYDTLIQGKWNASETFEYRHDRNTTEGLFGCFARLRGGLFVLGFAVADAKTLDDNPDLDGKWIMPRDLLGVLA